MSNTQELCRFDRSGVLNGGPKGRQNTKNRKILREKLQKLEFSYGGQTAPSEPAPRVGGTGDVLAGLLPSHSNIGVRGEKPPLHGSRNARVEWIDICPVVPVLRDPHFFKTFRKF